MRGRDYSLSGPENAAALEKGLGNAAWYKSPVPRKRLKELMQRTDGPATRDTIIWIGAMVLFAGSGGLLWGSWWCVLPFAAYGVLYGSGGDSRWHEGLHGTAFKTPWKNELVYQMGCFMIMRNPVTWRWSHIRHHTDTLIVGRDPEIAAMRPPRMLRILGNVFGVVSFPLGLINMTRHAMGQLTDDERDFVPKSEQGKVATVARIWVGIYGAMLGTCIAMGSILPAMIIGLPHVYGAWHHVWTGLTQHAGLAEDILDHRLNCRTVMLNPVSRFVYWNMNYHVEHHMYPLIPYHRLPELHEEIKHDCPKAYPGMWAAYREILPAVFRQLVDPSHFVRRTLPDAEAERAAAE